MLLKRFDKLETNIINLFLDEVKNNFIVEGVYARSYVNDNYSEFVDINIIVNVTDEYFSKIGNYGSSAKEDAKALLDVIDYYNTYALNNIEFSSIHALSFMKNDVNVAEATDLVSGEVLFDRFGRITDMKNKYSRVLAPYINAIKIDTKQI